MNEMKWKKGKMIENVYLTLLSGVSGASAAAAALPSMLASSPELVLLIEKTRRFRVFAAVVAVAVAALLPSSSFCEETSPVVGVAAVAAVFFAPVFSFVFEEGLRCFTAPESILENQKRFREFIPRLAPRMRTRTGAGMLLCEESPSAPPPRPKSDETRLELELGPEESTDSGSGALSSAKQEPQNSKANLVPKAILATKKLDIMARPAKVYALLFLPFSPAAERAQRR